MENSPSEKRTTRKKPVVNLSPEMQGRVTPHSRELEEAVLGGMMLERSKVNEVMPTLTDRHFYIPENQIVFKAIQRLYEGNKAIDLLTVNNELRNSGELELAGGSYYLAQLSNKVSSAANIEFHARILTQKFVQRELIRVSGEIATEAFDDNADAFEMLDNSERKLYEIKNTGLKKSFQEINVLVSKALKDLEDRSSVEHNGITGVASGFSDLDRVTSGWQKSDLVILAARPAMGKTAFALSLVRNAAVDFKKSVMFFSLEMADIQLVNRLISGEAEISADKIKKSDLTPDEWKRLHEKTITISESKIYIDDTPQLSIFDLTAKCRRIHSQGGLDMVVVDYLQLLRHETKGQGNREQEIAFISRSLKGLAKELEIPVIALAQLSREVEKRTNKRPQLSDLRESGSIEQDADMVMFLYREEYYKNMGMATETEDNAFVEGANIPNLTEIILAKHRHGSTGSAFAKFQSEYSKFVDLDPEDRAMMKNHESGGYSPQPQMMQVLPSKMNDDINPLMDDSPNPFFMNNTFDTGASIYTDE